MYHRVSDCKGLPLFTHTNNMSTYPFYRLWAKHSTIGVCIGLTSGRNCRIPAWALRSVGLQFMSTKDEWKSLNAPCIFSCKRIIISGCTQLLIQPATEASSSNYFSMAITNSWTIHSVFIARQHFSFSSKRNNLKASRFSSIHWYPLNNIAG